MVLEFSIPLFFGWTSTSLLLFLAIPLLMAHSVKTSENFFAHMIKFKLNVPRDFSEQLRKASEVELNAEITKAGYAGVSAKIDRNAGIKFYGPKRMMDKLAAENPDHFPGGTTSNSGKLKSSVIAPKVIKSPKINSGSSRAKKPRKN